MRNLLMWILLILVALTWSTAQATSAVVGVCPGESVIDGRAHSFPPFQHEVPPKNSFAIAQSLLGDYGKQPKEQWERDRKIQAEQLERIRRWDEYGKMRRCKQSCYDTYRTCIRRRWDPRSLSCQQDFNNCMKTCE